MAEALRIHLIFGTGEPKTLKDWPYEVIKVKMSDNDFVKALVQTSEGMKWFYVKEEDGYWLPYQEVGSNQTKTSR